MVAATRRAVITMLMALVPSSVLAWPRGGTAPSGNVIDDFGVLVVDDFGVQVVSS